LEEDSAEINRELEALHAKLSTIIEAQPSDARRILLLRLVEQISQAIVTHSQLIKSEGKNPVLMKEEDYFILLNIYLRVFRIMRELPRARSDSVYEIALVSCLDAILKKHCKNQPIE
jgi:hypothetical protein